MRSLLLAPADPASPACRSASATTAVFGEWLGRSEKKRAGWKAEDAIRED